MFNNSIPSLSSNIVYDFSPFLPLPLHFITLVEYLFIYRNRKSLLFSPRNLLINLHLYPYCLLHYYSWVYQKNKSSPDKLFLTLSKVSSSNRAYITSITASQRLSSSNYFLFTSSIISYFLEGYLLLYPLKKWQKSPQSPPSIPHLLFAFIADQLTKFFYNRILSLTHSSWIFASITLAETPYLKVTNGLCINVECATPTPL